MRNLKFQLFIFFYLLCSITVNAEWTDTGVNHVYESNSTKITQISVDENGKIRVYFSDSLSSKCNSYLYATANGNNESAAKVILSLATTLYVTQNSAYAKVARVTNTGPDYLALSSQIAQ